MSRKVVSSVDYRLIAAPKGSKHRSAVDLFSGAGGISLGLLNAGFDVLFASDISSSCAATHVRNLPHVPLNEETSESLAVAISCAASGCAVVSLIC